MAGEVIVRVSDTFAVQWFGESLKYLGATTLPVLLYVFTSNYCGRGPSMRTILLMFVIPTVSFALMVTNPWHYLFFSAVTPSSGILKTDFGVYFWAVHTPYCYSLLLICLFMLLMALSRSSRQNRRQIVLFFVSFCIPFLVNALSIFGFVGKLTPYSFPLFFSIVSYAMFRMQFLGSNPIAYETVFHTIRDGVLILDGNDIIHDINPAAATGLGKKPSEVTGMQVRQAFAAWPQATALYDRDPVNLGCVEVELFGAQRFLQIDSTPITLAISAIGEGRIVTIRDITDRHQHQLSLEAMAFHDPLTRVANRRKFQEEVERAVESSKETQATFAILYFDLNKFKSVNDTFGHDVGDELLKYVAARVASTLRKPDILARLGGDEFAVLLHGCTEDGIDLVIARVLENVRRPFKVGQTEMIAKLSIGTAFYPQNGRDLDELLRHADNEMYRAKRNGANYTYPLVSNQSESILEM